MASAYRGEDLECSICLNIYRDPVTLNCGHTFCWDCINRLLDMQDRDGDYWCPECRQKFKNRPKLERNILLCNIVESLQSTPHGQAGLKVRFQSGGPARVFPIPTMSLKSGKCPKHGKVLEYYCVDDTACLCASCTLLGEHRGHQVEKLDEVPEKKLRNILEKLETRVTETEERLGNMLRNRRTIQITASGKAKRVNDLFRDIRRRLQELEKTVLYEISRQEEEASSSLWDLIQGLQIERAELYKNIRHIKCQLTKMDPLTVLQKSDPGDLWKSERQEGEEYRKKLESPLPDVSYLDVDRISYKFNEALSESYKVIEHFRNLQSPFRPKKEVFVSSDDETLSPDKGAEGISVTVAPSIYGKTYSLDLRRPGLFRCSETGIQFQLRSAMYIEYQLGSWSDHMTDTLNNGYQIISPLFNIYTNRSSRMSAVHLPHCLSSTDYDTYKSYIKFVHFKDGKMILESPTRIDPSYIVLENPTFSFFGVVLEKFWTFISRLFPFKGIVLIYGKAEQDYCLHLYTMIDYQPDLKRIIDERIGHEFHWIDKAPQVESVYTEKEYIIQGLSEAQIEPEVLHFRFTCPSRVYPYTEITMNELSDNIVICIAEKDSGQIIWRRQLRKEQLENLRGNRPIKSPGTDAKVFIQRNYGNLCRRLGVIEPILLSLRDRGIINEHEEEMITQQPLTLQKNKFLLQRIRSKGAEEEFYQLLQENDPMLVEDLTNSMGRMTFHH